VVARAGGRRPDLRSLGPHLPTPLASRSLAGSGGLWYVLGWRVLRWWLPASMTVGGLVGQGGDWSSRQTMANAVHGVEVPW
jgi:hypothetical protein